MIKKKKKKDFEEDLEEDQENDEQEGKEVEDDSDQIGFCSQYANYTPSILKGKDRFLFWKM